MARDGLHYVTYTGDEPGGSPCLYREDILVLLDESLIEEKYPNCYRLRSVDSGKVKCV